MIANERGFTFAELLIAVAIIGMVLAALFTIQQQGQIAYLIGASRVEAQQNARVALALMLSELRPAQSITSATNCNTGTNDITFVEQSGASTIRYRQNGTNLERFVNPSATPTATADNIVIGGVVALTITCYEADSTTTTATPADIRLIKVSIKSKTDEGGSSDAPTNQQAVLESGVRLRNLL